MTAESSKMWQAAKAAVPTKPIPFYNSPWLNDCCADLFRRGTRIEKVTSDILTDVAPKVEARLSYVKSEKRRQCIYSLLGFRYVLDHFREVDYNPAVLDKLSANEKQALLEESKASVKEDVERLREKLGHDRQLVYYSAETPLGSFLADSQKVFKDGVEKHLRDNKKIKIKAAAKEKNGKAYTFEKGGEIEVWENRTDVLAQALVEVCRHEPERTWTLLKLFREKQYTLPSPVRNLVIKNFLFNKEKVNFVAGSSVEDVEKVWRERFLKVVHHNTSSLLTDRAIRSTLWQQIDSAVIETYGRVASLRPYDTDEHQMEAARALNILHVYNKNFEPILVFWLFPIQLTFNYAVKSTDSHVLELAMYLDLIAQHCTPTPAETFAVADEVIDVWRQWDKELLAHVTDALTKNVWINQKDFSRHAIHRERSEANKLMVRLKGRSRDDVPEECLKIFTDPAVFIRKWITEAFAGILSANALLFVWDQLFFNEWNSRIVRDVCLAIVFLLKSRFFNAKNYFGVREIFICDPGRLYTADLRRAYSHVQNGDSFDDIPAMNRSTATTPDGSRAKMAE